ncbi:putative uncharacterized protein [Rhodococcus sp. AW25M09]|nr:putative uncharacterized protein [Rhodococcus sp. AW25M09]
MGVHLTHFCFVPTDWRTEMKFAVPGVIAAVVGAVLGAGVVFGVTAAAADNSRPDIDRTGNADSSLLNQVEYGSR